MSRSKPSVGVVGLGYVGLPIAVAFARKGFPVVGMDVNSRKVKLLQQGKDPLGAFSEEVLQNISAKWTSSPEDLQQCQFLIVAVPTPVTPEHLPDPGYVYEAVDMCARWMPRHATLVLESTVYPGFIREKVIPRIENQRGWKLCQDFHVAYCPERMNPGDPEHTFEKIVKVVSACCASALEKVSDLYGAVVEAGVHRAPSLEVAEAAKVLENTQRNVNIALVNEFAVALAHKGISVMDVLDAARTKWNFHPYVPGVPGGHCIPVDPWWYVYSAEQAGFSPVLTRTAQKMHRQILHFWTHRILHLILEAGGSLPEARVLFLGLTFKEDVGDFRDSGALELLKHLAGAGVQLDVWDPFLNREEADLQNPLNLPVLHIWEELPVPGKRPPYDALVFAVAHKEIRKTPSLHWLNLLRTREKGVIVDLKGIFRKEPQFRQIPFYWYP